LFSITTGLIGAGGGSGGGSGGGGNLQHSFLYHLKNKTIH
jgi:hypothetical protein